MHSTINIFKLFKSNLPFLGKTLDYKPLSINQSVFTLVLEMYFTNICCVHLPTSQIYSTASHLKFNIIIQQNRISLPHHVFIYEGYITSENVFILFRVLDDPELFLCSDRSTKDIPQNENTSKIASARVVSKIEINDNEPPSM